MEVSETGPTTLSNVTCGQKSQPFVRSPLLLESGEEVITPLWCVFLKQFKISARNLHKFPPPGANKARGK